MRLRSKQCAICQQHFPVLFRIKHEKEGDWVFVCRQCWQPLSQNNPDYVYGGTWKAKK